MANSYFVTATDTGVGKTVVSTLLTMALRSFGLPYNHFKPVQSGIFLQNSVSYPPDLFVSGTYLRNNESMEQYCAERSVYSLKEPVSPDFAAEIDGKNIDFSKILEHYQRLKSKTPLIVEGAGGAAVPLNKDFLIADLIKEMAIPAIIVARSKLGTLNHTYLTTQFLRSKGVEIAGIVVCGYSTNPDISEKRNIKMLAEMNGVPVIGIVREINIDTDAMLLPPLGEMRSHAEHSFRKNIICSIAGIQ